MVKKAAKKEETPKEKTPKEEPKVEQKHVCDVCGKDAVARENDGHFYCYDHHMLWTKCWTHQKMVEAYQKEKS